VHVEAQLHQGIARQMEIPDVRYRRIKGAGYIFRSAYLHLDTVENISAPFCCAVINAGESGNAQGRPAAVRAVTRRKIAAGHRWEPGSLGENFCGMQASRILDPFWYQ
jgi:hypothetical protein